MVNDRNKTLLAIELYDLQKKRLKLHKLKSWVNGAVPELDTLNESLMAYYRETDFGKQNSSTNELIQHLDDRRRIDKIKEYYQEEVGGSHFGIQSIEETHTEIDEVISYLDERVETLLFKLGLDKEYSEIKEQEIIPKEQNRLYSVTLVILVGIILYKVW